MKGQKRTSLKPSPDKDLVQEAPLVIVVCANMARSAVKYGRRGAELYSIIDASLASENIMLNCLAEGLGSSYVGAFKEEKIRHLLGIQEFSFPIGLILIGYPDEEPNITDRLPIEKVVHDERW